MKTGRADYDQLIRNRGIPAGEPTFTVRAQDAAGALTVRAWASLARKAGTPAAVVEQALQQADAMDAWPGPKKPADADHLTPEQQKQLDYEHGRRAWKSRPDGAPDPEILLAERRGYDLALNALRAEVRRELEGVTRKLTLARRALQDAQQIRPDNWDEAEADGKLCDPAQTAAWRAVDEALRLTAPADV